MAEIKYVDWDGLVYYDGKSKQYIDNKFDTALKFGGSYTIDDVPLPGLDTLNFTYKITDKFVVSPDDLHFVDEVLNHQFEAGTILIVVDSGQDIYKFDILFEAYSVNSDDIELDLSNYYTQAQVDSLLSGKANKEDLNGLATEEFVASALNAIEVPDVSNFVTREDIDEFATKTFVEEAIKDVTSADLSNYYNKTETENLVNDAVKAISVPEVPTNVSAFTNDAQYTTLEEVASQGYLTEHQDLSEYAKSADVDVIEENVNGLIATVTSNSSSIVDIQDAVDDNTTAIASIQENVDTVESDIIDLKAKTTATDRDIEIIRTQLVTKTSQLENDSGYLTEATLPDFVQPDEVKDLVTLADVEAAGFIKSFTVPEEYVTESELNERGFITDVSGKADIGHTHSYEDLTDTPVIPSVDGLASEEYVDQAIANIDIPEAVDTSRFVTTDSLTASLATKANDVPFADDYRVGTNLGGFVVDESLQGMTVVQILTKLLGLTKYVAPEVPEGSSAVVEEIITNQDTIYSHDENGNLVETEFVNATWTEAEAAPQMNGVSTFYQIVDAEGTVIESGYQEATTYNEEAWLTIALPDYIESFTVKQYDGLRNGWYEVNFVFEKAAEQTIDGYIIWTVPEKYEVMSGSTYRFVIE